MDIDRIIKWARYAVIANFLLFMGISLYLGGDAIQGYVVHGHYFITAHGYGHGPSTEVTRGVFIYSEWHTISVLVTMPIMFLISFGQRKREP